MFKSFKSKKKLRDIPPSDGNEKFRQYVDNFKTEIIQLINQFHFEKISGEPVAPWICYHFPLKINHKEMEDLGIEPLVYAEKDSFYWYTLDAGIYMKMFLAFFMSKTLDLRTNYFIKYDLGPSWKERELWYHELFDTEDVSDEMYEKIHHMIFRKSDLSG